MEHDFDFIAASFVRRAADVQAVRQVLDQFGGQDVKIIAKIENQEGVDNIDEILAAADGVMVARGDPGRGDPRRPGCPSCRSRSSVRACAWASR